MEEAARAAFVKLQRSDSDLATNLWLSLVTDAVNAVVPANSALSRELTRLRDELQANPSDNAARVQKEIGQILESIDAIADLYKPAPSRQDLLAEIKQDLNRELDSAKQNLRHELDCAIPEQLFKNRGFLFLVMLLVSLILAFLGIDFWFSQKVNAAGQEVARMQEKVNGAKLAIYEKASELNKTLDDAREDLWKSRNAATDVLTSDRIKAQKDITGVKDAAIGDIKKEADNGSDLVKKEEGTQIDRLRKEATQKIAHINQPWAVWLLGTSWVLPSLAFLFAVVALIRSIWRR